MSEKAAREFLRELAEDEELEEALYAAVKDQPDRAAAISLWAVHRGYRFTANEFVAILSSQPLPPEELDDRDLDHVAGGTGQTAAVGSAEQMERLSRFVFG